MFKPKLAILNMKLYLIKGNIFSLIINNITVIELKAVAKQRDFKGYYKLRKSELIKLEALSICKWASLIPGLEIPRNTTRTVNTSAILDNTPVLQPIQKFIAKSKQKIKDFGNWLLDYIPPKSKVIDEALESFKNEIKKLYNKRDSSFQLKESKSALKKLAIQYRIDGKHWIDPDWFLVNAKQSITYLLINAGQTKVKLILSGMMDKVDLNKWWSDSQRDSISF